ncbi:MAG: phenylacetate--CoA ligase family protein [Geminicoccaceae bacterium]
MPENGGTYYDRLEVREPHLRDIEMATSLSGLVRHAIENAPGIAAHLQGVNPDEVTSLTALANLPVLRKSSLIERQADKPPFGGLVATPMARLIKLFASPGPIFEPESQRSDYWRFARALFAAGFRPGDIIHNSFAYHLTPAGSMVEGGARALGCPVIPAGTGQTDIQLKVLAALRPQAYTGTPSFLKTLLERAADEDIDTTSLGKALVSGEAFLPPLRDELRERFGVVGYQCYATADLGLIAYETPAREGLVVDESVIVEIVRPGTGDPVADGEVGEVVVTAFNPDYPLIRFATGDLSAIMPGLSPCGRTNKRIRGWLGRADQTTKVRGLFVHPEQIAEIVARHAEVRRARLVVGRDGERDSMVLHCECADGGRDGLAAAVVESVRAVTSLRADVVLCTAGTLANDGKVIEDTRPGS